VRSLGEAGADAVVLVPPTAEVDPEPVCRALAADR
jgi:hypothetical protein